MNIIIVGAGKVGSTIAENLSEEGHDVTVVDINADAVDRVCSAADIMGVIGNGIDYKILDDAQIKQADILIAMTGSDEINLLVCTLANERRSRERDRDFRTVARVTAPIIKKDQRTFIREKLGISKIFNPKYEFAKEISNYILNPSAKEVDYFAKDTIEMLSAYLPKSSPLCGKTIKEAFKKTDSFLICAIERGKDLIIPSGDDMLLADDRISFVTSNKSAGLFFKRAGIHTKDVRRVIIVGGGDTSFYLAKRLGHFGCKIKIIEQNPEKCGFLDENLGSKVTVINGDGNDTMLLDEEGIAHCDAFIAATDSDEQNIMLSLLVSSRYGVKTVTKVNKTDATDIVNKLALDTVIYPKTLACERIDSYVKSIQNADGSNVQSIAKIVGGKAYAIEFHIKQGSEVAGKMLSKLNIRDDVLLCSMSRKGRFIIPGGSDYIEAGDDVVVVTKDSEINDIREILKA